MVEFFALRSDCIYGIWHRCSVGLTVKCVFPWLIIISVYKEHVVVLLGMPWSVCASVNSTHTSFEHFASHFGAEHKFFLISDETYWYFCGINSDTVKWRSVHSTFFFQRIYLSYLMCYKLEYKSYWCIFPNCPDTSVNCENSWASTTPTGYRSNLCIFLGVNKASHFCENTCSNFMLMCTLFGWSDILITVLLYYVQLFVDSFIDLIEWCLPVPMIDLDIPVIRVRHTCN